MPFQYVRPSGSKLACNTPSIPQSRPNKSNTTPSYPTRKNMSPSSEVRCQPCSRTRPADPYHHPWGFWDTPLRKWRSLSSSHLPKSQTNSRHVVSEGQNMSEDSDFTGFITNLKSGSRFPSRKNGGVSEESVDFLTTTTARYLYKARNRSKKAKIAGELLVLKSPTCKPTLALLRQPIFWKRRSLSKAQKSNLSPILYAYSCPDSNQGRQPWTFLPWYRHHPSVASILVPPPSPPTSSVPGTSDLLPRESER